MNQSERTVRDGGKIGGNDADVGMENKFQTCSTCTVLTGKRQVYLTDPLQPVTGFFGYARG